MPCPTVLLMGSVAGDEKGGRGGTVQGEAGRRAPENSNHPSNRVTDGGADSLTLPPIPLKAWPQTTHGGWLWWPRFNDVWGTIALGSTYVYETT